MAHPVIPQVIELATPIADKLGLEVVDAVFQTNHSPPILRIDVRSLSEDDTGLEDCEQMSVALSDQLDTSDLLPDAYVLEVSSPGVSDVLTCDRDFIVFKGFPVEVQLSEAHKGKRTWTGNLIGRIDEALTLNQKGRAIHLPWTLVQSVQLSNQPDE